MCGISNNNKFRNEVMVSEDRNVKIWWETRIETTQKMEHNHLVLTVVDRATVEIIEI